MTRPKIEIVPITTGTLPGKIAAYRRAARGPAMQIPIEQIEPYLCVSVAAVLRYEARFRAGKKVPPIFVERSGPGHLYPFQIYNGAHRRQAASLAGRTVIDAKIVEKD